MAKAKPKVKKPKINRAAEIARLVKQMLQIEELWEDENHGREGVAWDLDRAEAVDVYVQSAIALRDFGLNADWATTVFQANLYTGTRAELEDKGWSFDRRVKPTFEELFKKGKK